MNIFLISADNESTEIRKLNGSFLKEIKSLNFIHTYYILDYYWSHSEDVIQISRKFPRPKAEEIFQEICIMSEEWDQ